MDTHKRRTFWQWLARKAQVQARLDREAKESWFRMGMAYVTKKPVNLAFRDYPRFLDEQASAQVTPEPPPSPQEPPTSLEALQASNDAFEHKKQVYAQHIRTQQAPTVQSWPTRMKQQPGRP